MPPLPWGRMVWVTWRQHRFALTGIAALLGVVGLYVAINGLRLHDAYAAAVACRPASSYSCGALASGFSGMNRLLAGGVVLQALPALIGAFLGAPLLARELEAGTFRYAWTQGFGAWRWTVAKLVLLGMLVAAAAAALSPLFSWYYRPYFATSNPVRSLSEASPFAPGLFDLRGVAFAAWTLAAFALGGVAGILIRRVVPAMAATLAAYGGLLFTTSTYLREHYLAPLVTTSLNVPGSAWILNVQWRTTGGRPVAQSVLGQVLEQGGPQLAGKGGVPKAFNSWNYLVQHGYRQWTTYQPVSRFWPFQLIEGGWLLALSLLLIAVTVWIVRRRAA